MLARRPKYLMFNLSLNINEGPERISHRQEISPKGLYAKIFNLTTTSG